MIRKRSASVWAFSCRSPRGVVLTATAILLLWHPLAKAAEPKARIGVVDTGKVLEKLLSWQDTQTRLEAEEKKAEKLVDEQKKELERVRAELEYFKPGSRDHEKRKAEVVARGQKLARLSERLRRALDERTRAALEAAHAEIRKAVQGYAIANKFDVVVDARAVFYVAGGAGISLKVAREMNKRYNDWKAKNKSEAPENK